MKNTITLPALFALALSGCTAGLVEPATAPPSEPMPEFQGLPPVPGMVWVAGRWHWAGTDWVWLPGHWESLPPRAARP